MSSSESEKTIKEAINLDRLPRNKSIIPLILYLPVGLALGLIRCFIFLHICILFTLLPNTFPFKRWILRIMLTVIGLPITTQGEPRLDNKKQIIISNHISNLDPFILRLLSPHVLAIESPNLMNVKNLPSEQIKLPADKDHIELIKSLKEKLKESTEPVLFFPEKVKTNGRIGVLKFSPVPFEGDHPIQPVTVQAKRPVFDVNISTMSSSPVEDLLWCLILPFTLFNIKYLPVTEKKKDENHTEFSKRVQTNMAKNLSLHPLSHSYTDVSLFLKETEKSKACCTEITSKETKTKAKEANTLSKESADSAEFRKMLLQVKDVLPDTPIGCIETELSRTHDVDATITNILEGKAEAPSKIPEDGLSLRSLSVESQLFKASKFEQTAKARQMSFAERKQAMLESARLKYRIKHGI